MSQALRSSFSFLSQPAFPDSFYPSHFLGASTGGYNFTPACFFFFSFSIIFFPSSDPTIQCIFPYSLTLEYVKTFLLFSQCMHFLSNSAFKWLFPLFQVSLLDYFLFLFNRTSLLRRAVNSEIYCCNPLVYFCHSGQVLALLCFCHGD